MEEDISIVDIALSAEEVAVIDALDEGEGRRIGPNPVDWIP